jgi:hypothetical protein
MSYTYNELIERMLYSMDAYDIIELLEITPEQLTDRFEDIIMKNYEDIEIYLMENRI